MPHGMSLPTALTDVGGVSTPQHQKRLENQQELSFICRLFLWIANGRALAATPQDIKLQTSQLHCGTTLSAVTGVFQNDAVRRTTIKSP